MSVSSETIMYIVSHKDFDAPQLPGYVPILAGAVKNHASIEVKDNTGDNICQESGVLRAHRAVLGVEEP